MTASTLKELMHPMNANGWDALKILHHNELEGYTIRQIPDSAPKIYVHGEAKLIEQIRILVHPVSYPSNKKNVEALKTEIEEIRELYKEHYGDPPPTPWYRVQRNQNPEQRPYIGDVIWYVNHKAEKDSHGRAGIGRVVSHPDEDVNLEILGIDGYLSYSEHKDTPLEWGYVDKSVYDVINELHVAEIKARHKNNLKTM